MGIKTFFRLLPFLFLLIPVHAVAQEVVKGSVFIVSLGGKVPIPASSYEVTLYDAQRKTTSSPSVTDAYGRFAFFGVTAGRYVLDISRRGPTWTHRLWRQEVTAPATLEPIVLAQSGSVTPRTNYTEVKGQKALYDFMLWLEVPKAQKSRIKRVTYTFDHPTFRQKQAIGDPLRQFKVGYRGWGCLSVVTILLDAVDGQSAITFDMCGALRESATAR